MCLGLTSKDMRKKLLVLILFFLPFVSLAQKDFKLVEKSANEKPNWASSSDPYLFVAYKAETIEDAKTEVLISLKNQIASSIATIISSEVVMKDEEIVVGSESEYRQQTERVTKAQIAKMPALQGIDLSKANIYWERYVNKKTKESCYDYYILYPFTQYDLQELIDIYDAQEKAVNDKIDGYRNSLEEIDDIDVMLENISQMKAMKVEHQDNSVRVSKLENIIVLYENAIKGIYVEVLENSNSNDRGTIVIQLMHGEKVMKTKSLPQLRSECARDFNRRHSGCQVVVTFNTFDCYEQDDNYVEIRYSLGKKKIIHKVNISM